MKNVLCSVCLVALAACVAPVASDAPPVQEDAPSNAPKPQSGARTAESLDTTTPEQRAEAVKQPVASQERLLGETVASLGNPTEPGFWIETPLVADPAKGRVVFAQTGKSVAVDLRPIDADIGAGSRLSLPAMRLLGAPLTGLPTVQVFGP